jgi:hypothetical protein
MTAPTMGVARLVACSLLLPALSSWSASPGASPGASTGATPAAAPTDNPPPRAQDWAALAKLPDWSGVWTPNVSDQDARITRDPVPWNAVAAARIAQLNAAQDAGDPQGLFVNCLPEGMPSWMLISHNALEILFTPGRVTMLGESDGSRLRRIYTDGRPHPADPDPTFHGHSIGHWEGGTLVIDTIGILPETYIAVDEAVGVPNNGELHVVERLHLESPGTLRDDIEVIAPRVMTRPWKTSRTYFRQRARQYDIVEGECLQGSFTEKRDDGGFAVFVPAPQTAGGNLLPPGK